MSSTNSNHIQTVIQNIMRNFQATSGHPTINCSPLDVNSKPLNLTPTSSITPKISATFLHFYSDTNHQLANSCTSSAENESLFYHPNANFSDVIENNGTNSEELATTQHNIQLNVSTHLGQNPFKRPLVTNPYFHLVNEVTQSQETGRINLTKESK